jgi:hypothetical protein
LKRRKERRVSLSQNGKLWPFIKERIKDFHYCLVWLFENTKREFTTNWNLISTRLENIWIGLETQFTSHNQYSNILLLKKE